MTITSTGDLSSTANFFTEGDVDKLVYTPAPDKAVASLGTAEFVKTVQPAAA